MDRTGSGWYPMMGLHISSIEDLGSAIIVLVTIIQHQVACVKKNGEIQNHATVKTFLIQKQNTFFLINTYGYNGIWQIRCVQCVTLSYLQEIIVASKHPKCEYNFLPSEMCSLMNVISHLDHNSIRHLVAQAV
jgi:hypothetical protein